MHCPRVHHPSQSCSHVQGNMEIIIVIGYLLYGSSSRYHSDVHIYCLSRHLCRASSLLLLLFLLFHVSFLLSALIAFVSKLLAVVTFNLGLIALLLYECHFIERRGCARPVTFLI